MFNIFLMKKITDIFLLFLVSTVLTFSMLVEPARAVTLNPNSGTKQANATDTITLIANPLNGETLVKLDLTFANITVTGFTANTAIFASGAFPECDNGQTYKANQVCTSLASSQAIPSGATIGTVNVTWGTAGTATVTAGTGNLYRLTSDRIDSGLKATYTIGSIPATPLLETKQQELLIIVAGVVLLLSGIYLSKQASKNERSSKIS